MKLKTTYSRANQRGADIKNMTNYFINKNNFATEGLHFEFVKEPENFIFSLTKSNLVQTNEADVKIDKSLFYDQLRQGLETSTMLLEKLLPIKDWQIVDVDGEIHNIEAKTLVEAINIALSKNITIKKIL